MSTNLRFLVVEIMLWILIMIAWAAGFVLVEWLLLVPDIVVLVMHIRYVQRMRRA